MESPPPIFKSSAHFFRLPPAIADSGSPAPEAGGRGVVEPNGHRPREKTGVVLVDGHRPSDEAGVAAGNGQRPWDESGAETANGQRPTNETGVVEPNGHRPFAFTTTSSPISRGSALSSRPRADPSTVRRLLRRRWPAIPPPSPSGSGDRDSSRSGVFPAASGQRSPLLALTRGKRSPIRCVGQAPP